MQVSVAKCLSPQVSDLLFLNNLKSPNGVRFTYHLLLSL